ncbi:MmcQ/YjbR family DNA-binding protein [Listeria ilorinensis]|uniref:MmcQ/YjbR family DNA-binding protein n=1 Tax=Listeria ilorinensis TaxID=2867439 RepID=UPI001EF5135F|nr:MmcQ/YjbR family DNA-binding protein [Listeria ilorinensis]
MTLDIDLIQHVALAEKLPGAIETFPFGKEFHVMRIGDKIFALIHRYHGKIYVSVKCQPERIELLRTEYQAIIPGYHLNKKHWLTMVFDEHTDIEQEMEEKLLQNSYQLIYDKLPRKKQNAIRFSNPN